MSTLGTGFFSQAGKTGWKMFHAEKWMKFQTYTSKHLTYTLNQSKENVSSQQAPRIKAVELVSFSTRSYHLHPSRMGIL